MALAAGIALFFALSALAIVAAARLWRDQRTPEIAFAPLRLSDLLALSVLWLAIFSVLASAFGAAAGGEGGRGFGSSDAAAIVVAHVLFSAIVLAYARARHGASPRDLGLRRPRSGDMLFAVVLYAASIPGWLAASMLTAALSDEIPVQRTVDFFRDAGPLDRLLLATTAIVTAPVAEEILFRGVLFAVLRATMGVAPSVILSSFLFAALHTDAAFLPLFWLGVVLALAYHKTGSLFASIGVHAAHNGVMLVLLLAGSEGSGGPA